jgi:APA family basic amino acid/polyamine antiporter
MIGIYHTFQKQGLFFKFLRKLNLKHQSPANSLLLQALWATVLVLSGSFDQLTDMLIVVAFLFYGIGALGLFKLPNVSFLSKTLCLLFVGFCAILVFTNVVHTPIQTGIGLALVSLSIPIYFFNKTLKAS